MCKTRDTNHVSDKILNGLAPRFDNPGKLHALHDKTGCLVYIQIGRIDDQAVESTIVHIHPEAAENKLFTNLSLCREEIFRILLRYIEMPHDVINSFFL